MVMRPTGNHRAKSALSAHGSAEADGNQTLRHNSGVYGFLLRFRYRSRKTIRFARGSLASRQCEMQRDRGDASGCRQLDPSTGGQLLLQACAGRPIVSAIVAPRSPSGFGRPVVVSRAV
jgi:hypothetical protein